MSTQVQFRRGTTTQNNAFTGAAGEISVDTDLKTIRLHDGTTAGGGATMLNNISAQTALNKTFSTGSVWQGNAVGLGYGGTGSALSPVAGAVAYSGSSGLGLTAAGTSGQVLVSGGTSAPTWVSASSISAGTSALAATATNIAGGSAGQLIIQSDTSLTTFITAGAAGTFLKSAGAGYAPTWAAGAVTIGSTTVSLGGTITSIGGIDVLTATGTANWTLPVGTTAQRPATPAVGMVRYNTTTVGFEGYSSGAWSSLGGVSSVDKFTYIQAETSAGASNGELEFFAKNAGGTAAVKVAGMNYSRFLEATGTVLGTQTTQNVFNTVATTVNAFGAATTLALGNSAGQTNISGNVSLIGGGKTLTFTGATSGTTSLVATAVAGTTTLTLPAATDTLVGKATTDTLTNKSMSGASNTFTSIPNSALTNSSVTITAGTGVTAAGAVSLGGSVTVSIGQAVGTADSPTFSIVTANTELRSLGQVVAYYSDERLKTNIKPIENALDKLLTLRGVTYNANDVAAGYGYDTTKEQVGVIAQDIEAVMPQVVVPAPFDIQDNEDGTVTSKSGENYKTVQYDRLVPLLIEAIKEQQKQIDELKAKLGN